MQTTLCPSFKLLTTFADAYDKNSRYQKGKWLDITPEQTLSLINKSDNKTDKGQYRKAILKKLIISSEQVFNNLLNLSFEENCKIQEIGSLKRLIKQRMKKIEAAPKSSFAAGEQSKLLSLSEKLCKNLKNLRACSLVFTFINTCDKEQAGKHLCIEPKKGIQWKTEHPLSKKKLIDTLRELSDSCHKASPLFLELSLKNKLQVTPSLEKLKNWTEQKKNIHNSSYAINELTTFLSHQIEKLQATTLLTAFVQAWKQSACEKTDSSSFLELSLSINDKKEIEWINVDDLELQQKLETTFSQLVSAHRVIFSSFIDMPLSEKLSTCELLKNSMEWIKTEFPHANSTLLMKYFGEMDKMFHYSLAAAFAEACQNETLEQDLCITSENEIRSTQSQSRAESLQSTLENLIPACHKIYIFFQNLSFNQKVSVKKILKVIHEWVEKEFKIIWETSSTLDRQPIGASNSYLRSLKSSLVLQKLKLDSIRHLQLLDLKKIETDFISCFTQDYDLLESFIQINSCCVTECSGVSSHFSEVNRRLKNSVLQISQTIQACKQSLSLFREIYAKFNKNRNWCISQEPPIEIQEAVKSIKNFCTEIRTTTIRQSESIQNDLMLYFSHPRFEEEDENTTPQIRFNSLLSDCVKCLEFCKRHYEKIAPKKPESEIAESEKLNPIPYLAFPFYILQINIYYLKDSLKYYLKDGFKNENGLENRKKFRSFIREHNSLCKKLLDLRIDYNKEYHRNYYRKPVTINLSSCFFSGEITVESVEDLHDLYKQINECHKNLLDLVGYSRELYKQTDKILEIFKKDDFLLRSRSKPQLDSKSDKKSDSKSDKKLEDMTKSDSIYAAEEALDALELARYRVARAQSELARFESFPKINPNLPNLSKQSEAARQAEEQEAKQKLTQANSELSTLLDLQKQALQNQTTKKKPPEEEKEETTI